MKVIQWIFLNTLDQKVALAGKLDLKKYEADIGCHIIKATGPIKLAMEY